MRLMPCEVAALPADFSLLSTVCCAVIPLPGVGMTPLIKSISPESVQASFAVPVVPVELIDRLSGLCCFPALQFGDIK